MFRLSFTLLVATLIGVLTTSWNFDFEALSEILTKKTLTNEYVNVDEGNDEAINFLALGDWGGAPLIDTLPDQVKNAAGMGRVAREINADFVVTLGDNFYLTGVENVDSKRFQETFENVYSDKSLMDIPWYMIGGNHDHFGNIDAQIQYTTSKYNTNKRWKFPSLYHAHSFVSKSKEGDNNNDDSNKRVTIDLIMIDTVDLCSKNEIIDEEDERYSNPLPLLPKSHAANNGEQWQWIEDQMSKSQADYLLVAGHYPVFSVCIQGPTKTLIHHLRPLLLKYGAHYLAGHDHCMNHFVEHDQNSDSTKSSDILPLKQENANIQIAELQNEVNYILVGTGIDCCSPAWNRNNKHIPGNVQLTWSKTHENNSGHFFWKKVKSGFASFSATKNGLNVQYHDHKGNTLYEAKLIKPRKKKTSGFVETK